MSGSVNKCHLLGFVGRDPEITDTRSGDKMASFSLATNETWKDKGTGERKQATDWHNIVVFDTRLVPIVEQYVKKGSRLWIVGQHKTRTWEKDGHKNYRSEIVLMPFKSELTLLDSKDGGGEGRQSRDASDYGEQRTSKTSPVLTKDERQRESAGAGRNPYDDDIPFAPEWRG